jgi:hypothetical protein
MNFVIRKNSTLPSLKYKITELVADGTISLEKLKGGVVTFSMIEKSGGKFIVANRPAGLTVEEKDAPELSCDTLQDYFLTYKWARRDTVKAGAFIGEFRLDFVDSGESVTLPLDGSRLEVTVSDGIASAEEPEPQKAPAKAPTKSPANVAPQTGSTPSHTYEELHELRERRELVRGAHYLLNDYQTTHDLPMEGQCGTTIGAVEPLLLLATDVDKFDQRVSSTLHETDIIHYAFDQRGACGETHKGLITYREDTVNHLSAYFDWRLDASVYCGIEIPRTFGEGCRNVSIGPDSKYVYVGDDSEGVTVGGRCRDIVLPAGCRDIRIGDAVVGMDFTDAGYDPISNRNLTVLDGGRGGSLFVEINFMGRDVLNVGEYRVGLLPKGMVVTDYALSVTEVPAQSHGTTLALGIAGMGAEELMEYTTLGELSGTFSKGEAYTDTAKEDTALTLSLGRSNIRMMELHGGLTLHLTFMKG